MSKKAHEVVFARPVLAQEFFSDESKKKFDALPDWQRHFLKRLVDHGDLPQAAHEAGVSTYVKKNVDLALGKQKTIKEALAAGGIDSELMVHHLKECLDARMVKLDGKGNPVEICDLKLKLSTIQFIAELRGDIKKGGAGAKEGDGEEQDPIELFESTDVSRKD